MPTGTTSALPHSAANENYGSVADIKRGRGGAVGVALALICMRHDKSEHAAVSPRRPARSRATDGEAPGTEQSEVPGKRSR
jgi:hypothetical protein